MTDLEIIGVGVAILSGEDAAIEDFRFTGRGVKCRVTAADADGVAISDYALGEVVEVCMPFPNELRSRITDVNIAVLDADRVRNLGSSRVLINGSDGELRLCGLLNSLPATFDAVVRGGTIAEPVSNAYALAGDHSRCRRSQATRS